MNNLKRPGKLWALGKGNILPRSKLYYVMGIEHDATSLYFSGGKISKQWRLRLFDGRNTGVAIWNQNFLAQKYLKNPAPIDSPQYLQRPIEQYPLRVHASPAGAKEPIYKFSFNAHLDASRLVFPDRYLVTQVVRCDSGFDYSSKKSPLPRPADDVCANFLVSNCYNGRFRASIMTHCRIKLLIAEGDKFHHV